MTKPVKEKPTLKPRILFVWERGDGQIAHILLDFPLTPAWIAQIEASHCIWASLIKRGVIV